MKPSVPVARRADYEIVPLDLNHEAHGGAHVALVRREHYAHGCAKCSTHAHGLVRRADNALVGVCLWMPPTKIAAEAVARKWLGGAERWREVLACSRLVIVPGEPQNAAGMLLAGSTRLVCRDPRWALGVTWADTVQGHTGTVYKAVGWTEDGRARSSTAWYDAATGKLVSRKSTTSRSAAWMDEHYQRRPAGEKIRFVVRLK